MITKEAFYGGATRKVIGAGAGDTVFPLLNRIHSMSGGDATSFFQMEDARRLPKGAMAYLISEGFNYPVKNSAGGAVGTTQANTLSKIFLLDNSTQAGIWRLIQPPVMPTLPGYAWDINAAKGVYDSDSGGTLITVDNTAAGRAEDQGPSGYHESNATAGDRPAWRSNVKNGRPVLRFVNDYLENIDFTRPGNSFFGDLPPLTTGITQTVYVVYKIRANTGARQRLFSYESGGNLWCYIYDQSANKMQYWPVGTGQPGCEVSAAGFVGSWRTDVLQRTDAENFFIRSNGVQVATHNIPGLFYNAGVGGVIRLGAYDNGIELLDGDIARVLVYAAAHTPTEYAAMEAYLRAIYATW